MKPKSLLHCHSKNLHSIIIGRTKTDDLIRMFVATKDHLLFHNGLKKLNSASQEQELAIHSHKSDITLFPLSGEVYNIIATKEKSTSSLVTFNQYEYSSPINNLAGGFEKLSGVESFGLSKHLLTAPLFLSYNTLHTIFVPEKTDAAWLVVEGKYTTTPSSISYSNKPLDTWDAHELYTTLSKELEDKLLNQYFYGNRTTLPFKKIDTEVSESENNKLHELILEYVGILDYSYIELVEKYSNLKALITRDVNSGTIHSNRFPPSYIPDKAYSDFEKILKRLKETYKGNYEIDTRST